MVQLLKPISVLTSFVIQVSEDAMKEKNEIISRLEDKTNQINATMKQLEQRYSPIFISLHSQLHPLTAFLQLPLKRNFQLEHLNQTFLKFLISALLFGLVFFFVWQTHSL